MVAMYSQPIMAACAAAACKQDTSLSICEHSTEHSGAHQCCNKQSRCELADNVMERDHRDIDKYDDGCAKCGTKGDKADKDFVCGLHDFLLVTCERYKPHQTYHKQPGSEKPEDSCTTARCVLWAMIQRLRYCLVRPCKQYHTDDNQDNDKRHFAPFLVLGYPLYQIALYLLRLRTRSIAGCTYSLLFTTVAAFPAIRCFTLQVSLLPSCIPRT